MSHQGVSQEGDVYASLSQIVRESEGKVTYKQLWNLVRAGQLEAYRPTGEAGHYRVRRADVRRLLEPVQPPSRSKN